MVAKSYSTEYGGMCVWVEDLYMKEEARGLGIGTAFFRFLDEKYKDQAVRFRLEVEEDNEFIARMIPGIFLLSSFLNCSTCFN